MCANQAGKHAYFILAADLILFIYIGIPQTVTFLISSGLHL